MEIPPAPRYLTILIGSITGLIGLGLLILVVWIVYASVEQWRAPDTPFLLTTVAMACIGAFLALVSYRLLVNRGSRVGGGLLSPTGWRVLGGIFTGFVVLFVNATWRSGDLKLLSAISFGILFA